MPKNSFLPPEKSDVKIINLQEGAPSNDLMISANELIARSSALLVEESKENPHLFAYTDGQGSDVTRTYFSSFLSERYNDEVSKENLLVTNGASVALQHIITPLFPPHSQIMVISADPYYPLAIDIFKNDLHCNLQYVASTDDGLDLEGLEMKLKDQFNIYRFKELPDYYFACCLYLVPIFNNPRGKRYTPAQCEAIVDLAHKYKTLIISDDVYSLLQYKGNVQKRLVAYDYKYDDGCVVSNGSFSKILMPSIRVGWLEGNKKLINRIADRDILFAGGCVNQYSSLLIAHAIKSGDLDLHLNKVIALLKERVEKVENILTKNLPEQCNFDKIEGGYFIWLKLPSQVDSVHLKNVIFEKHKILIMPGQIFSQLDQFKNFIRICFSRANSLSDIENGCLLLCQTIRELMI